MDLESVIELDTNSIAFWSTVSQIVPVLALALVFEVRLVMRRWARKKSMPSTRGRLLRALGFFVVVTALGWAETRAIAILQYGYFYDHEQTLAQYAIVVGLFPVVSAPVGMMIGGSLSTAPPPWVERGLRKRLHLAHTRNIVNSSLLYGIEIDSMIMARKDKRDLELVDANRATDSRTGGPPSAQAVQEVRDHLESVLINLTEARRAHTELLAARNEIVELEDDFSPDNEPKRRAKYAKRMRRLLRELAG